jgi:lipid A 3-O-deacylase
MKRLLFFLFCLLHGGALFAFEYRAALLSAGGGYLSAGSRHSGGLFQIEYKWNRVYCQCFRPQAELIMPEFRSLFLGVGCALELYLNRCLLFCPNFSAGLYYCGKGKDLGFPLEFRSALEFAYEFQHQGRIGLQIWHISNASLGHRNPGANAVAAYLAFPIP